MGTPYVMGDGTWYRDMLTIEASRAVGQFAQKFHKFPQNNYFGYNERRHYSEIPPQYLEDRTYPTYHKSPLLHNVFKPVGYSPQKSSVKQQHPIYDNALDYGKVHLIHIPRDLQVQRAIADK